MEAPCLVDSPRDGSCTTCPHPLLFNLEKIADLSNHAPNSFRVPQFDTLVDPPQSESFNGLPNILGPSNTAANQPNSYLFAHHVRFPRFLSWSSPRRSYPDAGQSPLAPLHPLAHGSRPSQGYGDCEILNTSSTHSALRQPP